MKRVLAALPLVGLLGVTPVMADQHECPTPEGCGWRSVVDIKIIDENGNENWAVEWTGPRMSYIWNVEHAYLLLEHIFSREPGATKPELSNIIRQLKQNP